MKALVCDDSRFMRSIVANVLQIENIQVVTAENGNELLEVYERERPDIVTLDIVMNQCDGLKGLQMLLDRFPDANVIMVSAMGQKSYVMEAVKIGAKDFIVKPFKPKDLLATVMRNLNR